MFERNTIEKAIDGSEPQIPVHRLNEWRTFVSDGLPLAPEVVCTNRAVVCSLSRANGVQTAATNNRSQALCQMFLTGHSLTRSSNQAGEPGAKWALTEFATFSASVLELYPISPDSRSIGLNIAPMQAASIGRARMGAQCEPQSATPCRAVSIG